MSPQTQPTLYIPHGGGPCFFMEDPHSRWTRMGEFLRALPRLLPEPPKAILVISGHWETRGFAFTGAAHPSLYYDYYGFPEHTYHLRYDAPGAPDLARRAAALLNAACLTADIDHQRGLDHGVFIPLMVAFPEAEIPVVEMSLDVGLDPALHLAAGRALAELRGDGVLILGAGMSVHNIRAFGDPRLGPLSAQFDAWLSRSVEQAPPARTRLLADWERAPGARACHPREEHLLPLMVAAGAADEAGHKIYDDTSIGVTLSGYQFG